MYVPGRSCPASMQEDGKTSIDCHKGIAHSMPEGKKDD
jgi:nitrate/TMAO reductase-like tetraheme cytochrome c subunit